MRSVSFKYILHGVARSVGLDPTSGDFSPELAQTYTEFITARLREAREHAWWPELTVCEIRQVDSLNDRLIPLVEADKQRIANVRWVTNANPFLTERVKYYPHLLNSQGINIPAGVELPEDLYVTYRPHLSVFDSTPYESDETYLAGVVRYVEDAGDCYECLQTSSGENPANSSKWQRIIFPYVFSSFVRYAAAADALREDGQHEKAERLHDRAIQELSRIEDVELVGQEQVSRASVAVG